MFQQPLYDCGGNAVLSKDRTEGFAWIVEFEITQPKLLPYLRPSVSTERTIECLKVPYLFVQCPSLYFLASIKYELVDRILGDLL